jgi:hypothetical protein
MYLVGQGKRKRMSTNNRNDQPTNHEQFVKQFAELIARAQANGQAPPTADAAIEGMNLISDLYQSYPATETSAKLAVSLAEVLYFAYPEFGSCYLAVAKALAQQDDETPSEVADLLNRIGLDATHADLRQAMEATQIN